MRRLVILINLAGLVALASQLSLTTERASATGVTAIAAGESHSCALTSAADMKCWGLNNEGQLGIGTTNNTITPVDVSGLNGAVGAVSAILLLSLASVARSPAMSCEGRQSASA